MRVILLVDYSVEKGLSQLLFGEEDARIREDFKNQGNIAKSISDT